MICGVRKLTNDCHDHLMVLNYGHMSYLFDNMPLCFYYVKWNSRNLNVTISNIEL